ncbi:hypothetical protein Ga0100231_001780 [Opitutaceae bacterium TAV4]|nr:hypothetical protein Ga0100231_001780 [Opitutaceae bacterium TAV4]
MRPLLTTILLLLAFTAPAATTTSTAPRILFHLDFETGFTARAPNAPGGTIALAQTTGTPTLVPGKRGQAAHFGPGQVLAYPATGNLDKTHGSLAVWLQAPQDGLGPAGSSDRHTLFREDGPYTGRNTNTLWIWQHLGRGLRADMRDPRDRYIYMNTSATWKKGEWHHIVITWDNTRGTQAYVDGEWVAQSVATQWTPKPYERFFIGAADARGLHPWDAAIDELTIYDRELTEDEVRAEFLKTGSFTTRTRLFESYLTAEQEGFVRLEYYNPADTPAQLTRLHYTLAAKSPVNGEATPLTAAHGRLTDQTIAPHSRNLLQIPLTLSTPGDYRLTLSHTEASREHTIEIPVYVHPATDAPATSDSASTVPPATETLIAEIDITTTAPLAQSAPTAIIRSPLGAYREAGPNRHDRFAIEFSIDPARVTQPHIAVITYPDDKARTMEMMLHDLTGKKDFQAQIGVFTGDEYPVSDKMLQQRILFWPRSTRQSFIFMTAEQGKPAAAASIKIYHLDSLPPSPPAPVFQGSIPAREIGIYYEDPVLNQSYGESADFPGFAAAMTRTLDYMQSFSQGTLLYPVAWYEGPLYGSIAEPLHQSLGVGGVRPHPPGYPAYFARRLAARDMTFNAGLHMHMLASLMPAALTDLNRIHAGEETVLNMRRDGQLWHGHYHGSDPGYNPLDPRVQKAVANIATEIVDRYGDASNFTGLSLVLARVKIFAFGSAESGYNDTNLQNFQRDTGVSIPGYTAPTPARPGDPQRFAASYRWLRATPAAWKSWIDWRCAQLHAHYKRLAEAITARRPDLKLTLNLFTPRADYARMSDYLHAAPADAWREMGIDPALYANDPSITLAYTLVPADYRWRRSLGDKSTDLECNRTVFFAPESAAFMRATPHPEAVIHDRYWEDAIGRTSPMRDLPVAEHPWRCTTLNAAGRNSLEPYAAAINNFDAQRITKGGYLIGTFGMEREIEEFSRAYRALPAVRFDDIPGLEDPVRVRQKTVDGRLYYYALNRLPESVEIKLQLNDGSPGPALTLKPFELRTFVHASAATRVTGGRVTIAPVWLSQLQRDTQTAIARVASLRQTHPKEFARFSPYADYAQTCLDENRPARLHYLLQEHWAIAARKLASAAPTR